MILAEEEAGQTALMAALGRSECLLVRSWRRIAAEEGDCALVACEFIDACGEDGGEVLATFTTFLRALACASRRHLRVGHPGCAAVTSDEQQLLTLIAAAQAGETARFEANLRWLAGAELRHALAIAASALAAALAAHGYLLALPQAVRTCRIDPAPNRLGARFKVY